MKKTVLTICIVLTLLVTMTTPVFATDYVLIPRVDISQYQDAPRLIWWTGQEIPEDLVLMKDDKVYVPVELFSCFKNTMAFNWLDDQPIAIIQHWNKNDSGPNIIIIFALVQQPGEEKPFFIAEDGTTYVQLYENAERIGAMVANDSGTNTITVSN